MTARLGVSGYLELAVKLGIVPRRALNRATRLEGDRDKAKRVNNWLKGVNPPRFADTMRLLSEAGLLQPEAEAAWRGITLEEAELAVEKAREQAEEAEALARLESLQSPPHTRTGTE